MKKIYNKLVRDKIPEIIKKDYQSCDIEILSDDAYLTMLDAKLDEELAEYHADQNLEELADLLEVVYAAAIARGYTIKDLESLRLKSEQNVVDLIRKFYLKASLARSETSHIVLYDRDFLSVYLPLLSPFRPVI